MRLVGRIPLLASAVLLTSALLLTPAPAWCQPADTSMAREWGLLFFGGQISSNDFYETLNPTVSRKRKDIYFAGAALSRRVRDGRYIDLELEGGGGYQFSDADAVILNGQVYDNDSGQIWGALYVRYDVFPWNHLVHTTVAISTGLNYSFEKPAHEEAEDHDEGTKKLLHYLSPEITLALPDHKEWEAVLRLHHRSGVFGFFGCNHCGSNVVTVGVRKRF